MHGEIFCFLGIPFSFQASLLNFRMLCLPRLPRSLIIGLWNHYPLLENSRFAWRFLRLLMFIILLLGLPQKLPIINWKNCLGIFFELLVPIIMASIEFLGIFVVSQKNLVVLAYFPHRNKALIFGLNRLFMLSLEMKPRIFLFDIVSLSTFLSIGLLG